MHNFPELWHIFVRITLASFTFFYILSAQFSGGGLIIIFV